MLTVTGTDIAILIKILIRIYKFAVQIFSDEMASSKSLEVKPFDHTIIIMDASNNVPLLKFETCPPDIRPFCVDKVNSFLKG